MKHNIYVAGTPQRIDSKGFEGVRLVVSFGGKQMKIATGVHWKPIFINKDGISQGDAPLKDYLQASKKINDLKLKISEHLETNTETTPERIKQLLQNRPTIDFISYAYAKLLERHQKLEIGYNTYKAQKESIARLENFKNKVAFQDINLVLLESYKLWLKNQKYKRNTIWTSLKDFRTYLNTAIEDGIQVEYPFGKKFKMPKGQRRIKFLHEDEFQAVKNYYETTVNIYHREVLRAFLFSCYTGLRIGDMQSIRGKNIINKTLVFEPRKTKDSETKEFTDIEIPLHPFVLANLPTKLQKEMPIFENLPSEQKINLRLKEIAKETKTKPVTYHDSRHTFATRFLAAGGRIEVLQKLLGHESILTTMIYIHIEPSQAKEQINLLT